MNASPSYFLTPQAQADVEEIIDYLLTASVPLEITEQVFDRIYDAFERIASQPGIGRKRPEWTSADVRFWARASKSAVGRFPVFGFRIGSHASADGSGWARESLLRPLLRAPGFCVTS